ncbi:putative zinc finger/helix-turn-helix protein, YgiT family [Candidatus Electrothrix marina]|uniref:Putative zinc finger/helix-turn-helix protein, YgiT family n=1 Tax=Candidatus Electrothrix marina TaxID=1859130 RepID=A0A444JC02_9BACT|nr:putative zinc finger/helix-turn-helix protein, YgiT family [Candidatus Electrothrix marina]
MDKCYMCGNSLEVIRDKPYEYTESGLNVLLLGITQYRCGSCEEEYAAIPAPEKLHKIIGLEICRNRKALLLPEEIKFLRKEMNLKSKELASSLGVDESTVSRWENGRKRVGEGSDRLLRTLYLSCTEEEQDRRNILEVLKSFPHHRKEIGERQAISLNPQDWLLPDCACAV